LKYGLFGTLYALLRGGGLGAVVEEDDETRRVWVFLGEGADIGVHSPRSIATDLNVSSFSAICWKEMFSKAELVPIAMAEQRVANWGSWSDLMKAYGFISCDQMSRSRPCSRSSFSRVW